MLGQVISELIPRTPSENRRNTMNAPVLQIVWSHRRLFLGVMGATFLALAIGVFILVKPHATVRSAIEIGSVIVNGKQEPFEPAEQVARRITGVYAPAVLLAMARKGTSPSILSALQDSSVDNIGSTLVVISSVDAAAEEQARDFQQAIADQIAKDLALRAQVLHGGLANQVALATRASGTLEKQIAADAAEIERIDTLSDDLRGQIENRRADLARYPRTGTSERSEAETRELQGALSNQTALLANLTLEHSRFTRDLASARGQHDVHDKTIADGQLAQTSFNDTQVSLPPSLMPASSKSRRLGLLFVALVASILVAFGTVVLVDNTVERKS